MFVHFFNSHWLVIIGIAQIDSLPQRQLRFKWWADRQRKSNQADYIAVASTIRLFCNSGKNFLLWHSPGTTHLRVLMSTASYFVSDVNEIVAHALKILTNGRNMTGSVGTWLQRVVAPLSEKSTRSRTYCKPWQFGEAPALVDGMARHRQIWTAFPN